MACVLDLKKSLKKKKEFDNLLLCLVLTLKEKIPSWYFSPI